ncbi:MAG TPA: L,D-transpeptidase [Gemmatimonadaceae bacterium]|nr:L,D-transpeptidase [Gemmatimonadaceae bacterium]
MKSVVSRAVAMLALGVLCRGAGAQSTDTIQAAAARDTSLRVIVSVDHRRLWAVRGMADTLLNAPVAVGSEQSLAYASRRWTFATPRGVRSVIAKEADPVWVPPDWHFVEVAQSRHLRLVWLHGDTTIALDGDSTLVERGPWVGLLRSDSTLDAFSGDDIVLQGMLFVPPIGSDSRRVRGQLGHYRLDLGDGIGIHGTPDSASIGKAATHGCMRLRDADIAWLFDHVPLGARVYIY